MVVAPAVAGPWLGGWVSGWVDCGLYLSCFILYIYIDWFIYIYTIYNILVVFFSSRFWFQLGGSKLGDMNLSTNDLPMVMSSNLLSSRTRSAVR